MLVSSPCRGPVVRGYSDENKNPRAVGYRLHLATASPIRLQRLGCGNVVAHRTVWRVAPESAACVYKQTRAALEAL